MKKKLITLVILLIVAVLLALGLNTRFIPVILRNDSEPLEDVVLSYKNGSHRLARLPSGEMRFIFVTPTGETPLTLSFKDNFGAEHQKTAGYVEPGYIGFFQFQVDHSGAIIPHDSIIMLPRFF